MNQIRLYTYGRYTANEAWDIDHSRVLNRLYYINSGTAEILNASTKYRLVGGKIYVIPQCKSFNPICAEKFDHTYFDFYSSSVLRSDGIIEIDGSVLSFSSFFEYVNAIIASEDEKRSYAELQTLLSGFLEVIDTKYSPLPYITNPSITLAVNLIQQNCAEATTRLLAERTSLNESYFIRLFTSVMGTSPMKYIRAHRVSFGKELLRGGATVSEAAEQCGYSSPSAFYNAVKKELGIMPSDLANPDKTK